MYKYTLLLELGAEMGLHPYGSGDISTSPLCYFFLPSFLDSAEGFTSSSVYGGLRRVTHFGESGCGDKTCYLIMKSLVC
eukprot:jgi/Botrbrau1/9413/Bobra.0252s0038.1